MEAREAGPVGGKPVRPAIQRRTRLIVRHLRHQANQVGCGDVGGVGQDQVEPCLQRACPVGADECRPLAMPSSTAFRAARAAAAAERSTPIPKAAGNSDRLASSRQPVPVPRSSIMAGCRATGEGRHRSLDQRLRFGTRDQRVAGHPEVEAPELPMAKDQRQRFARRPAVQQRREPVMRAGAA